MTRMLWAPYTIPVGLFLLAVEWLCQDLPSATSLIVGRFTGE